jgi:hypothetical protein
VSDTGIAACLRRGRLKFVEETDRNLITAQAIRGGLITVQSFPTVDQAQEFAPPDEPRAVRYGLRVVTYPRDVDAPSRRVVESCIRDN